MTLFSSSIDVVQAVKVDEPEMVEEEEATMNEIVTEQSSEDLTTEMLSLEKLFSTTFKNDVLGMPTIISLDIYVIAKLKIF